MCPICWISGFVAVLFGGSFIAIVNHPISLILGFTLIIYSIYKFYEAKKRGKKMKEISKSKGWNLVRWITQDDNVIAKSLYDRVSEKTNWDVYELK